MRTSLTKYFLVFLVLILSSCQEKVEEKPFVFNGNTFKALVVNSIKGNLESKGTLKGLLTLETNLSTYNKILIDSININNAIYYTLLLENQNPVYNLFAVVDNELNLILKDESLNGYLNLNFKKSGSRIFAVLSEEFNSKDDIQLVRNSYYSLEEYSSDLVFRQFTKIITPVKEAEQIVTFISDTTIVTNISYPTSRTNKSTNDIFKFDVAHDRYTSNKYLFDSLVYKEIRDLINRSENPQITDMESILKFIDSKPSFSSSDQVKIHESDFEITPDSNWKKIGAFTISNFVKKKLIGIKYINAKLGAEILLAAIAPTDSAENYFYERLINKDNFRSVVRYSDKLIDSKYIYQLYEFSCVTKKILMILAVPKSTYETYKSNYEDIIQNFLIKC